MAVASTVWRPGLRARQGDAGIDAVLQQGSTAERGEEVWRKTALPPGLSRAVEVKVWGKQEWQRTEVSVGAKG